MFYSSTLESSRLYFTDWLFMDIHSMFLNKTVLIWNIPWHKIWIWGCEKLFMILLITDSDSLSASCIQYSECSLQKEVVLASILDLDRI